MSNLYIFHRSKLSFDVYRRIKMARRSLQLDFALREPRRWGGCRPGAGRKPGPNRGLPHSSRQDFSTPLPAHVTMRVGPGVPSLRTVAIVRAVERSFADACARPGFRLVHYSLQGNHAHLIVEARDRRSLGCGMKAIAGRIARAVNRVARRRGKVFTDRYHLRLLATPREVHHALRYVLLNARHHLRAAAVTARAAARFDPASSARWFDGWTASRPAETTGPSPTLRPVARARTWLLQIGWRRHGLLDPADVPG